MKRWVRIVLIVVLAAGLVVGLFGMLRRQTEDRKGAESYAEAAAIAGAELPAAESAAQTPAEEQETQDPYLQMFARMDVEALRQVNPEVLGWLWLPNTQISYPLMQGTDNEYYLHNTWKNEPNELGAIFLDHRSAPELHFSISHSGGRWVCAFADAPVGLDLQVHRPCRRVALARRFFAPEEAEWLRSRGEAACFDRWCAKESWLKYTGRGLSALPEAIVLAPDGQFPARPDARLQLLPVFDGYSLCVCTKDAARVALREL